MENLEIDSSETVQKDTKEEKKWCVYCHTSPSGKKYIGITSQQNPERRFNHGNGYLKKGKNGQYLQPKIAYAILKYPDFDNEWEHEILYNNLTKVEAEEIEKQLIAEYKTQNSKYGYNIATGGGVMIGEDNPMYGKSLKDYISEEEYEQWKINISIGVSKFYADHPEECKKRSDRTKTLWEKQEFRETFTSKMSGENNPNYGSHRFAGENHPMYGKHHTEESKKKNRDAHVGKQLGIDNVTSKPIYCRELDEIFWGSTQVQNELKINAPHVSDCCRDRRKSAGKHPETREALHWKYVYDQTLENGNVIFGAITLGYITEDRVNEYLNNLKNKGD